MARKRRPPDHLTEPSKRWWRTIATRWRLEAQHCDLLDAAAGCRDRIEQARKLIDTEGLTVKDRFGQMKPHPAAAIERDQKGLFARLVRELALSDDVEHDARPPRLHGRYKGRA